MCFSQSSTLLSDTLAQALLSSLLGRERLFRRKKLNFFNLCFFKQQMLP